MTFDFSMPKDGLSTRSSKWVLLDKMMGGAPPRDILPMWIAQMDFQPAPVLQDAMERLRNQGEYGYFALLDEFHSSVAWWSKTRHGWTPDPDHILLTHGLGNAIGLTLQTLTEPGDGIIVFSPVYHEFQLKIRRNGREVVESPLQIDRDGLYRMDLEGLEQSLTGREKAVLFSSPHNPAGRVWDVEELRALATFCDAHDLLLISDEIHQDLVFPGHTHIPFAVAAPEILPRLVCMSAASKTFDIAGLRTGYVIIPDDALRARFQRLHSALDIQVNRAGVDLTRAAYTPEGAAWVDALLEVLDTNRQIFCDGLNAIPGVNAMPMQSTFLAWIDFGGTGMTAEQLLDRVQRSARVVPTPGHTLGVGGETRHRFNIGAPTEMVRASVARLQEAFSDLQ